MPDRYVDAVCARRAELRALSARLAGGHRAELRSCLALARLAVAAEVSTALAGLGREFRLHLDRADRAGRARLPGMLVAALDDVAAWARTRWLAAAGAAARRIAAERSVPVDPSWPAALRAQRRDPGLPRPHPPEPGPGRARALLLGVAGGAGVSRLVLLPAAGLPLLGLPAVAGPAVLPLAGAVGVAAVLAAGWARAAAAERARLRAWSDDVLALARAGCDAELGRRLIELERSAGAELDAALALRRAAVDAELAGIAAGRRMDATDAPP